MHTNVSKIHDCYGCGVCAATCPVHIIIMELNSKGLLEPHITDQNKCIDCGICLSNCAFNYSQKSITTIPIRSFAAYSKDRRIQRKCSSGGVTFEICAMLIEEGYKVCAVKYNVEKEYAEHYIAENQLELIPSIGSKYIQSHTESAFSSFKRGQKYVIVGTPCQIDSLRKNLQRLKIEQDYILIDFFCHGVPSYFAWSKYLDLVKKKVNPITEVTWRNKKTGWHDSWAIGIDNKNTSCDLVDSRDFNTLIKEKDYFINSRLSKGDLFYNLFLGDYCMSQACCKSCKYKYDKSAADIRVGDLWGSTYQRNQDGVSALITFTEKGNKIADKLWSKCVLIEDSFETIAEGQMKSNSKNSIFYPLVMKWLTDEKLLPIFKLKLLFALKTVNDFPIRVFYKILKVVKVRK